MLFCKGQWGTEAAGGVLGEWWQGATPPAALQMQESTRGAVHPYSVDVWEGFNRCPVALSLCVGAAPRTTYHVGSWLNASPTFVLNSLGWVVVTVLMP